MAVHVIVAVVFLLGLFGAKCQEHDEEFVLKKLRQDLLSGYDRNSRPIQFHNMSTFTYVYLIPRHFKIDEVNSIFELHGWFYMWWRDDHFKWTPQAYGNITRVHFASHEIWQPDLYVYNNADNSDIDHYQATRARVSYRGLVSWFPPSKFQTRCVTNLRLWPYDSQKCNIILGSWTHSGNDVNLKSAHNGSIMTYYMKNSPDREWDIVSMDGYTRRWSFGGASKVFYPDIKFTTYLKRKSDSYSATVIVPALMIVVLSLVCFWLHPSSPERLNLSALNVILTAIFLQYLGRLIPNNGSYPPLIVLFFRDSMVMIGIFIVLTIVFRRLLTIERSSSIPLPFFVTNLLDGWVGKILCLNDQQPSRLPTIPGSSEESGVEADNGNLLDTSPRTKRHDWAWIILIFDRLAFVTYVAVFSIFVVALL